MSDDPFAELKKHQREMWASFTPGAMFTTVAAAHLVRFAGVVSGCRVLDIGSGTGVVAITAARAGARVTGLDLTPALLDEARKSSHLAGVDGIEWAEGDAEQLPYPDESFDLVLSQFGHMFAPRPDVVVAEMRRVLKPGGRLAFATWPPEHFMGRMFALVARHSPPAPPGAAAPPSWGSPDVVGQRLAQKFEPPFFERGALLVPALSPAHLRVYMEPFVGPMQVLVRRLAADPTKLAAVRSEFEALIVLYHDENVLRQDYLLTRALAR